MKRKKRTFILKRKNKLHTVWKRKHVGLGLGRLLGSTNVAYSKTFSCQIRDIRTE